MRRWLAWGALAVLAAAAIFSYRQVQEFIRVDRCLDRGGSWNEAAGSCEGGTIARLPELAQCQILSKSVAFSPVQNRSPCTMVRQSRGALNKT